MQNWTYLMNNFVEVTFQGYVMALGVVFWPLFFTAIIGYVYVKQKNIISPAIASLLIFSIFGEALLGVDIFITIVHVLVTFAITAMLLLFLARRRR